MKKTTHRYRVLAHTADGKFRAFGDSIEEAFANAALAMVSLMWDWEKVARRIVRDVDIRGRDLDQLLYKYLEEALYLFDSRKFMLAAVEDLRIDNPVSFAPSGPPDDTRRAPAAVPSEAPGEFRLTARFVGDDRPELYEFFGDVKAVTYNEMKIGCCDGISWVVQVVVDK